MENIPQGQRVHILNRQGNKSHICIRCRGEIRPGDAYVSRPNGKRYHAWCWDSLFFDNVEEVIEE